MQDLVSIIIPCLNEEGYIKSCIESILSQDYQKDLIEILVVDGGSNDNTLSILKSFSEVTIINNPNKIVPISMNLGIKEAKGDFIIRIDAHCLYPKNYVSELIKNSVALNADNIGCIMETLPANDSSKAKAIAIGISHPLGVGNSYFRVGSSKTREVDTVPFGCYKKEVFKKIGYYDEELVRNQDDELNARLIQNGGKIFLLSNIILKYYARDTITKVYNMFFQYGLYKPLVNKKLKKPATIRQFIPLLFVLNIILGGLISLFFPPFLYFTLFTLSLYIILILWVSLKIKINKKLKSITLLYLPVIFFVIHFSYGWGYIKGIIRILTKQKFNVKLNR